LDKNKPTEASAKVAQVEASVSQPIQLFMARKQPECHEVQQKWIVDSGASCAMSSHREWFATYHSFKKPMKVWLGNDSHISAEGEGSINIELIVGNQIISGMIQKVLYIPELQGNLLSVSNLTQNGLCVIFETNSTCHIYNRQNALIGEAHLEGNVYILHTDVIMPEQINISKVEHIPGSEPKALTTTIKNESKANIEIWH
jgi:hypothetical protein